MPVKTRTRRGISLIETVNGTLFLLLAMGLMIGVTIQATRMATKADTKSSQLKEIRVALNSLSSDIGRADAVLVSYPKNNGTFQTQARDSIILRIPRFGADAQPSGDYDVALYRLVQEETTAADTETTGTYELVRYTATIVGGVESTPVRDRTIAKGLSLVGFSYGTSEEFTGDNWRTTFNLRGTPVAADAYTPNEARINNVDFVSQGFATYSGSQLTFERAPVSGAIINATYRVDPRSVINSEGANAANVVNFRVRMRAKWMNAASTQTTSDYEINTRVQLRNAQ